ncbi:ArsR/SmtB family transcription factor [Roseibium algae]|uniref:Metalloregulator ArsR/SmtB family transcription factor n=1 Tax=Roseibium algae TaxID=3123038 RepID=A0ABU8TG29_9HYPH
MVISQKTAHRSSGHDQNVNVPEVNSNHGAGQIPYGPPAACPDIEVAAQGFAALGSESRLEVVLTLVKAGKTGLTVGDIQTRTGMAASTLAHHLKFLSSAGLVMQEKVGRAVINRAAFDHLEGLASYIMKECCVDERESPQNCCADEEIDE